MEIKTVSLIGLGALGTMFAYQLSQHLAPVDLRVIVDGDRAVRYTHEGIYCNGTPCHFNYMTPDQPCQPADLLLIAVKYNDLGDAIAAAKGHVGPDTIILSLLNGITSEDVIGASYGMDKVLLCVAQGMDATKIGNQLSYQNMGRLCFGDREPGTPSEKVRMVERFFIKTGIPHEVVPDMKRRQWSKFMFNAGINQVTAVYRCNYAGVQAGGEYRQLMLDAMREVAVLSQREGVCLNEDDIVYWQGILAPLNPLGKTSMQQDVEAGRRTEVEMFAGTALALGKKHGIPCPVNQMLYDRIKELESGQS